MRSPVLAAAVILALAAPAAAVAADPPTILTAGIDAQDQLYATWMLGLGTTYDHISFATSPDPDPVVPAFFQSANFAAFGCGVVPDCDALPTATSFRSGYPISRDRRYFVKVAAQVPGVIGEFPTSAIWIIDETKPLIAGKAPVAEVAPSNSPATGRLLAPGVPPAPPPAPPPPPPTVRPTARFTAQPLPKTFAALRLSGVRVSVRCTAACAASGSLTLKGVAIGRKSTNLSRAGTRTFTVKLSAFGRRRLAGRSRARLKIAAQAKPAGGVTLRASRNFTVVR
ncbi:MAG: hypothetical protein QOJ89_620 [bacterium]|jgi:hypothetical protein